MVLLTAARFYHLTVPIDDPHSWRQADTANYVHDFVLDGIRLLSPTVCWQGNRGTLILEFPFYEAFVAVLYQAFGEHIAIARLVTIGFWLGSLLYLYLIADYLYTRHFARLTAVVYAILPLGLFYSRAIHVDFSAVFAAHAMLYYFLRGTLEERHGFAALGASFGALACVIKVPYAFYLYVPLLYLMVTRRSGRSALPMVPWLLIPFAVFSLWWRYVISVNMAAPDWSFLPGYFKFVRMGHWYFGTVAQRLWLPNWQALGWRVFVEVLTPAGALLAVAGLLARDRDRFIEFWLLAVVGYVLIFFNVNLEHDYYQLPLLAGFSLLIARGILWLTEQTRFAPSRGMLQGGIFAAMLVGTAWAARDFYSIDWLRVVAGQVIEARSTRADLVITSIVDTDPRDPRLLYRARRHGFSVSELDLTPALVARLEQEGARLVAVVRPSGAATTPPLPDSELAFERFALAHDGLPLGELFLARLR